MKIAQLSGGVGGARLARGLAALDDVDLTVVVNVGDDAENHGLAISPDLDTVVYTLAGVEGPYGWGRAEDTFILNDELDRFGLDNTFRIGDRDAALKLYRTQQLADGVPLSKIMNSIALAFDLGEAVLPVTDDRLRTMVRIAGGWITFQEYFVDRRYRDEVLELRFDGASRATPAPGVLEAISASELLIIGPSNPPLSIWPILAVQGVREAVAAHPNTLAMSPLIGGKTVKGPADRVMESLGMPAASAGVEAAYDGLIDRLVVHTDDLTDASKLNVPVAAADTLIKELPAAKRLARFLVDL